MGGESRGRDRGDRVGRTQPAIPPHVLVSRESVAATGNRESRDPFEEITPGVGKEGGMGDLMGRTSHIRVNARREIEWT